MIRLQEARRKDRELLYNINQKYLYEMTNYYDDPMDESGNYHYGHFEDYFTDPKRRAYFLYNENALVGFAMLCPYSYLDGNPDWTMAEFTIFPQYRRRHYAMEAAEQLLAMHPGSWEIKYNEKNSAGKNLWNSVAAPYGPEVRHLNEEETVLVFRTDAAEKPVRKTIRVAAAVILRNGQVFATQRGYGDWKDYWEFPGGKIEPGETPEEALAREIREELDTVIAVGRKIASVVYDYPAFRLSMDCFLAEVLEGSLILKEHEAARWLDREALESVQWLPADLEILQVLKQVLAGTDETAAAAPVID